MATRVGAQRLQQSQWRRLRPLASPQQVMPQFGAQARAHTQVACAPFGLAADERCTPPHCSDTQRAAAGAHRRGSASAAAFACLSQWHTNPPKTTPTQPIPSQIAFFAALALGGGGAGEWRGEGRTARPGTGEVSIGTGANGQVSRAIRARRGQEERGDLQPEPRSSCVVPGPVCM